MSSKVLLATFEYPPFKGGIARYLEAIVKTFEERIDVLYWPKMQSWRACYRDLRDRAQGYAAIWVSHIYPAGTAALMLYTFHRKPYVIFLHGTDFSFATRNIARTVLTWIILRCAQHIVVNSQALSQEIEHFCGRTSTVIYPVVSDRLVEESRAVRHHKETGTFRLLTVARLVPRKGHELVLDAIQHLEGVEYLIVGSGPNEEAIEKKIQELNLEDRVEILSNVSDSELAQVYNQADVFIMPTTRVKHEREGFGIVYLEAQLFEVPVIATRMSGVDEAVLDGVTGILVDANARVLEQSIQRLIENTPLRDRMGRAGREFVLDQFTREHQMKKLRAIFPYE